MYWLVKNNYESLKSVFEIDMLMVSLKSFDFKEIHFSVGIKQNTRFALFESSDLPIMSN